MSISLIISLFGHIYSLSQLYCCIGNDVPGMVADVVICGPQVEVEVSL